MNSTGLPLGEYLCAREEDMTVDRRPIESWWQAISEFVLPRKSFVTESGEYFDDSKHRRLYDTTAIDACNTLANGHSSYITPGDQRWFYWGAPEFLKTDEVEEWYRKCSEIAALEIASSNFYTSIDEGYLDRSGFGISQVSFWPSKRGGVAAQVHPVGSYCLEEDDEGGVDTVYFTMEKGIRQLHQMFGDDILKSEKLANAYKELQEKGKNKKMVVIHCVFPRGPQERQTKSKEGKDLPIASIYICKESKIAIRESGFTEMPYCTSRFLKHTGRGNQYGFSPSWRAMPAIAQVNFLQKVMDVIAEKKAIPPVLIPDYLEGDVDLRGGGATIFKASRVKGSYALPQEWATGGDYAAGAERVQAKQDEINRAFHVDLFRMFNTLVERGGSPPTATQVAEMSGEKLVQFSPSFTRFVSDFQVGMNRIFGILLRAGKFPPPPPGAIQQNPYTGKLRVEEPKVVYQSKIALAIQQLQNGGIDRLMERAERLAAMGRMDALDNLDVDQIMRSTGRNDGVPEEVLSPPEVMEEIRTRRAEQQQMEQEMAMAEQAGKAASGLGNVIPMKEGAA